LLAKVVVLGVAGDTWGQVLLQQVCQLWHGWQGKPQLFKVWGLRQLSCSGIEVTYQQHGV
jgi:hypothetical protein